MISTAFASALGGFLTFLEIILSALVGFFILANFRYGAMQTMQLLRERKISEEEFSALNLFSALGAFLLIVPGFFTDILGIVFQVGFLAAPLGHFLLRERFVKRAHDSYKKDETIIDVEVIEKKSNKDMNE